MSFLTQSHQVFFGVCLIPSTSHVIQRQYRTDVSEYFMLKHAWFHLTSYTSRSFVHSNYISLLTYWIKRILWMNYKACRVLEDCHRGFWKVLECHNRIIMGTLCWKELEYWNYILYRYGNYSVIIIQKLKLKRYDKLNWKTSYGLTA